MPTKKRKGRAAPAATAAEAAEKKKAKEEAKAKKEAEKARKLAEKKRKQEEEEAKEQAEMLRRAHQVVSVLNQTTNVSADGASRNNHIKPELKEPIFKGQDDGSSSSHAAPRAFFSAVECQDLERAQSMIKAYRFVADTSTNHNVRITDPNKIRKMEQQLINDGGVGGLKWMLPFDCPHSKSEGNADVNAISEALRNGQMDMLDLLLSYYGWKPLLGDENNFQQRRRHHQSSHGSLHALVVDATPLPPLSFQRLIQEDTFVAYLPHLTARAMRYGRIPFVRRALRFFLGLNYTDLDLSFTDQKPNLSGDTMGVTMLHIAALEARSETDLKGLVLDENTTNAPALDEFVTPLHLAALSGNQEVYRALEKAGGDWTIPSDDGLYAISYAAAAPGGTTAVGLMEEDEEEGEETPEPAKKRSKKNTKKEKKIEEPKEPKEDDGPIQEFRRTLKPSGILCYMTRNKFRLEEDLQHEFDHLIGSRRCLLEAAIRAGRHHNVAWFIHWFDETESTKWYPHNGELSILQHVIREGDANMLSLFLSQPKFKSTFLSSGSDLMSTVVDKSKVDMLHLILDEWKEVDEKDKVTVECTPVHLRTAIGHESLPMVRALLKEGKVDVNSPEVPMSALHVACAQDFVECAMVLLEHQANPRAVTSGHGVSVMQHTCRSASTASIKLLMDHGISLDLKQETEIKKKQDEEEKAKKGGDDVEDMETEETSPFEGWFMVLTGIFSVSKDVIKRVVESQGGKVQAQVNGKTTHCVHSGRDGYNDYGQRMGQGDKKYTAAKKKKLPFLNEDDILRYLKRTGQAVASHETSGNLSTISEGKKGHEEASFLHDVIKNCSNKSKVPSVQILLDHGADRMILDDYGRSPFHYAVLYLYESDSNLKLLETLQDKDKKVLVNQFDKTGLTPLLQACISKKWKFVEALLQSVEDVNLFAREPDKEETKADATMEGQNSKRDETKEGGEKDDIDAAPKPPKFQNVYSGWSLAHFLLVNQKVDLFKRFIELGGDVNTCLRTPDATPLVVASILNPDICRELLTNPKCDVNATNSKGQTLLHAVFVRISIGNVLTNEERTAFVAQRINAPFTQQIYRPTGEASIIHLTNILRWNPDLDASLVDKDGTGVFHAACANEDTTSCIRSFLAKGDPTVILNQSDGLGNSPLAIALLNRKLHVVLFLLDQGADINGYVYSLRPKEKEQSESGPNSPEQKRNRTTQVPARDDREIVDEERMRTSIYTYVMRMNMSADIIYNILRLPACDMSAALRASICTGNLKWTEQLIRSVDVKTPEEAGKFVRLLFSSTANPTWDQQEKMMELSKRLAENAGGVTLDTKESNGYNVLHTMVGEYRIQTSITAEMFELLGKEESIQALKATEKLDDQTVLHMAVIDNQFETVRLILTHVKENGTSSDLQELLDTKDSLSKTAIHYAVGANSQGTYLNGALLSLLAKFGSKITIPDKEGKTVANVIGQMPPNQLDHFKMALAGLAEDESGTAGQKAVLLPEAEEQIDKAQTKRKTELAERRKQEKVKRKESIKKWENLQDQWEEFRSKRLEAKSTVFEETRQKARKGGLMVPLDKACPDSHAYKVHIGSSGDIYDALLISSDLRQSFFGSNSFLSLQVVELTESYKKQRVGTATALANAERNEAMLAYRLGMAKYRVVERWGRIGDWDTKSRASGFTQLSKAIAHFEKIFHDKTKNDFAERESFEAARGAYNWVQKVYDDAEVEDDDDVVMKADGSMPKSIETFLRAITSLTRVRQDLRENGFGVDGLPLGQLSPNTISDAYKILMEIEERLEEMQSIDKLRGRALRENKSEVYKIKSKLTDLSNQFYTTIPHDFGSVTTGRFKKPEVIQSRSSVEKCLQMLLSLEDVESSINLLLSVSSKGGLQQRLNDIYNLVGCDFRVVEPETDEFKLVQQYANKGANGYIKIAHLLEVSRYEDSIRFVDHEADRGFNDRFGQPKNRLLWHGSKMSNILGILMKGLKIAPPEAPVAGYNFGKGIYMADVFAKSASYSSSRSSYNYGYHRQGTKKSPTADVDHYRVMLLCEVALGEPCKLRNPNSDLKEPPEDYDSVQCIGQVAPAPNGMFLTKEGVGVPLGQVESVKGTNAVMGHNEFIVYDESRVRIKYVMLFE